MRLTVIVPVVALITQPVAAQRAPVTKLLDKIPSIFGNGPHAPEVTLPATPAIPGLTQAADRTIQNDPSTYDLGGFRLGMSEGQVVANMQAHGLKSAGATHVVDFESQVRSLINTRGGAGGAGTRHSVLGDAQLKDDAGGTYMLKMLGWPDGAHLYGVTYVAPQGTPAAQWRQTLVSKWGRPTEETPGDQLTARWGSGDGRQVRATAVLGSNGGTVELVSPDGTSSRPGKLVDQAADAFFASHARKPTL